MFKNFLNIKAKLVKKSLQPFYMDCCFRSSEIKANSIKETRQ